MTIAAKSIQLSGMIELISRYLNNKNNKSTYDYIVIFQCLLFDHNLKVVYCISIFTLYVKWDVNH